ncbi:transport between ER and Golgi ATPase protein [Naganishia albida]|nr:transport between ER and Golgi ATPase protein [Naganishia albida]
MPAFFNRLNTGAPSNPTSGATTPTRQPAPAPVAPPPPQRSTYDRVPQADPYAAPYSGSPAYARGAGQQQPPNLPARGGYQDDPYAGARQQTPAGYPREKAEYRPRGNGSGVYGISACPTDALALTNRLVVHPSDFPEEVEYVRLKGKYILGIVRDPTGSLPVRTIGPSKPIRMWCGLSMQGEQVEVEVYQPQNGDWAGNVDLEVGFNNKKTVTNETYDTEELSHVFINAFSNLPLTPLQSIVFDYKGQVMKATVRSVSTLEGVDGDTMGIIMEGTEIQWFKDPGSAIKLKNSSNRAPTTAIIAPNFKFEDMGIGGLDNEFSTIFRRAFASRVFPPGLIEKLGITHTKGMMLYGPPGTGKTLMARQIGKMLNAAEPKVVNGPEILNKFVGQSEENIRKLFADAEKEQKEKGDESGLHIVIFDEIDAICKQRGSQNTGTGVGDSVVNQLLSKMDGVEQLNNILVIGMTNRLDMIDEALLRPGRFEIHIEISLPDEQGRVQILNIHTSKMRINGVMADDVNIQELASLTKNFSGAELNGLVKSATSFAFNRHIKVGTMAGISDDINNMKVSRDDFMHALDEVHPAFGVSEEELQQVVQNGIIHFNNDIENILRDGSLYVEQVRNSTRTPLVSVLLHGPSGSGKTALAATMAMASDFPFIKLLSPESMIGFSESAKIAQLNKVFNDSYKSPLSVIVIDSIERILDWIPIGPRFSNGVLQALMVLLGKRPPKGRRLLILATTSNRAMLDEMEMSESFDADIRVPAINDLHSVERIIREVELFQDEQGLQHAMGLLRQAGFGNEGKLNIGVKKLLSMTEMARQDPDPAEKLAGSLIAQS